MDRAIARARASSWRDEPACNRTMREYHRTGKESVMKCSQPGLIKDCLIDDQMTVLQSYSCVSYRRVEEYLI